MDSLLLLLEMFLISSIYFLEDLELEPGIKFTDGVHGEAYYDRPIFEILNKGLTRIDEAERLSKYNFTADVEEGGEYDVRVLQIISNVRHLKSYFKDRAPPILNGEDYKVTAYVGKGKNAMILLAEERNSKDDVIIKIIFEEFTDYTLRKLLDEYMYQEQAYEVLKSNQCRTTKPLGFIRQKASADKPHFYMFVAKYCPVLPGYYSVLSCDEAVSLHGKKPICRKIEWRNIFLALIKGVEVLQKNDIYHNDLNRGNILLEVSDNRIDPVLIDFGNSSRGKTGRKVPRYKPLSKQESDVQFPYTARELFEQPDPLPTTDLYSLVTIILDVAKIIKLPTLENYALRYRQEKPQDREGFTAVYAAVKMLFDEEIIGQIDLTIEDRAPPLEGKKLA